MHVRRIELPGLGVEVAEAGVGGRPLMVVHGFTGSKDDFIEWIDPLAGLGWHVVAPDLRGHGASDHPAGEEAYDFPILAADLLALAVALGWERFTTVAHSMGGMLAQLLAIDHPERLQAMVLVGTPHGPVRDIAMEDVQLGSMIVRQAGMTGLSQALSVRRAQALERPPDDPHRRSAAMFERMCRERPGWVERSERKLLATSPDLWLALAPRFITQHDRLDRLAAVTVPTAVIAGEFDHAMREDCERIAKVIPGAQLAVIPDAGHSPQFENPAAWWDALVAMLEHVSATGGPTDRH